MNAMKTTAAVTVAVALSWGCSAADTSSNEPVASTVAKLDTSSCPAGTNIVVGTDGDDVLVGTNGRDCIVAGGGNDQLSGGNGDDVLLGGDGDDRLDGGNGS